MDPAFWLAGARAPYFVGWGTLALINAGLAQGKNRSGLLWFFLSLLLGPVATLLIVVLPAVRNRLF
ncbi:MAG TPA: antitermination protein NusB [Rhodanobacteraceae bacterium]|nr:antitermination protein NusB [Rhodanobacteraceae bacterium]